MERRRQANLIVACMSGSFCQHRAPRRAGRQEVLTRGRSAVCSRLERVQANADSTHAMQDNCALDCHCVREHLQRILIPVDLATR